LPFKGIRPRMILAALTLTLAILFGAKWIYMDQALHRPLAQAIAGTPGVVETIIAERGNSLQVRVKVADTPEIETFVASIWRAIDTVESGRKIELVISDSRSPALEEVFYAFHFFVQEAVATGSYSDLPLRLAQVAPPDKVARARVFVGSDYVYVQLHQSGSALYEIVPRQPSGLSGDAATRPVLVAPWGG
jgi:hypothetical protein